MIIDSEILISIISVKPSLNVCPHMAMSVYQGVGCFKSAGGYNPAPN